MPTVNQKCRHWMLYALGGGMGHLTRALAFARAAVRRMGQEGMQTPQTQICLLTNSPFARYLPTAAELGTRHRIVTLSPCLSRDETATRVINILQTTPMDVLVVDTFPRGLGGELTEILPKLQCHKILIHRDLNPRYSAQSDLKRFVHQFDRLIVPGESAPFDTLPQAVRTAPWLIRDAHELLSPTESQRMLEVDSDIRPIIAVIGCGRADEIEAMRSLAIQLTTDVRSQASVRFVTPHTPGAARVSWQSGSGLHTVSVWPFLQAIRGVSIVVGSGGYNTVHEARVTQTPLIGLPRPRLYDRQNQRLRVSERAAGFHDVRQRVAAALESPSRNLHCPPPRYENGVHQAIELIESLYA